MYLLCNRPVVLASVVISPIGKGGIETLSCSYPCTYVTVLSKNATNALICVKRVAGGGAAGCGTALQVGRSRFRSLIVSLEFFIDIIFPAALWSWG